MVSFLSSSSSLLPKEMILSASERIKGKRIRSKNKKEKKNNKKKREYGHCCLTGLVR
jgi:hypothetical protein